MMDTNMLFILEMTLFSVVAIGFALREIIVLSPKNIAKAEAKAKARAEAQAALQSKDQEVSDAP